MTSTLELRWCNRSVTLEAAPHITAAVARIFQRFISGSPPTGVDGMGGSEFRLDGAPFAYDTAGDAIVGAVSDSVSGMFMQAIPLMAGVLVMALALREIPLRTSSAVGGQDASTSPAATPAGATPPATVSATHDPSKEL